MTSPISAQLSLYFSEGSSPYPKADPRAVLTTYGVASLRRVEGLAEELGGLRPDWTTHDLASGTAWAVGEMRQRHPELDDVAAKSLAWAFSFWNR